MSTLWLVATPIGNLGDLAPRAIEILSAAELICCEDTRRTAPLLSRFGVAGRRLAVCNDHTEHGLITEVIDTLDAGGDVAIVSDAGTPAISDPGQRLVEAVIGTAHRVSSVPGPSAAIMALTISGLDTSRFVMEGFLPRKGADRTGRLDGIATETRTIVLYEAPHRIMRTLQDLRRACGDDRRVVVARELTKLYEEVVRGRLDEIEGEIGHPRGEYVVVVEGHRTDDSPAARSEVIDALREQLDRGASTRDAATRVAAETGWPRREVYDLAVIVRRGAEPT